MNKVTLIGRLVRDPELRTTSSNISVCSFTVAVDRRFKSEGQPTADFIPCIAWRSTAEFINKYFKTGSKIAICGSIQTRNWDDKEGKRHYATEVIVDEAEFCEKKASQSYGDNGLDQVAPPPAPSVNAGPVEISSESEKPAEQYFPLEDDSDIPF